RTSFEYESVDKPAVEAHPHPHAGLRVVGLLGRNQIVEFTVQMRDCQHRQHTRDRLVLGLLAGGVHAAGLAEGTDARPKKKPAVMSRIDAAYAHQIGTANASDASTNLPMPIIPSDTATQTAPIAVHGVGNRASSAAHTIAPSTAMYSVTGTAMPSSSSRGQNHTSSTTQASTMT